MQDEEFRSLFKVALRSIRLTKYYSGDNIKKTEMGRERSTYGVGAMHRGFWLENLREGDHLDDQILLRSIFEKWDGGMDSIDVAQDRDWWRALVNAVMNLRFPYSAGNFLSN